MMFPGQVASPGFYAMLGMGAMMGATLQAPLAALMTLLELTANPNIILPGMLAVVVSGITASHVFGRESVFLTLSKARGLDYRNSPMKQSLRRVGVASVLNTSFSRAQREQDRDGAVQLLDKQPLWILIEEEQQPVALLLAADLAHHLNSETFQQDETAHIDLRAIPAQRYDIAAISELATLQQALDMMNEKKLDALYVTGRAPHNQHRVRGVITRQAVEAYYRD
jgi:CIC family chloride channel protein